MCFFSFLKFFFFYQHLSLLGLSDGFGWELDQVARLFGPAIFEASKLKVLFLGVDENKHPGNLPRTYTLTHSDITAKLTLAISQTINNSQVFFIFDLTILFSYSFGIVVEQKFSGKEDADVVTKQRKSGYLTTFLLCKRTFFGPKG